MASKEFEELQAQLAAAPAAPPMSLAERRAMIDNTMGQLPLAPGTQAEAVDAGGVPAIVCAPEDAGDAPWLVYLHGGGYRMGSALGYRAHGSHLAAATGARVLLVDYRLAPENPFPAAVDDAVAAYGWVLEQGAEPGTVVIGGDSAGGGLTLALMLAARDQGLPLPAGGICLSPWVDLTNTNESYTTRGDVDTLFSYDSASEAAGLYLKETDPRDVLASPLFGNLRGLPPLLVLVGEREVLFDDAAQLAATARAAGVEVEYDVYPEMPHVWQLSYPAFPEAVQAVEQMGVFIARCTAAA